MTVCVTTNYLDPRSFYPVLDPRRTAGTAPFSYGYALAFDGIVIRVERVPGLSSCEMTVVLRSTLHETKEIQAWNLFANTASDSITTSGSGQPVSMSIRRAWGLGNPCGVGTNTVVLCRHFAWPRGRTALYCFPPQDFWDFWGGCKVTFDWFSDTAGSGVWGSDTPAPTYPLVRLSDGTLLREDILLPGGHETERFYLVVGGAAFRVGYGTLGAMGLSSSNAITFVALPSTPVDGTLVRELDRPEVYVVYGGAKFWIPDPIELQRLGFTWNDVRIIPPGGTAQLRTMPVNGTILKAQKRWVARIEPPEHEVLQPGRDPIVEQADLYLVENDQLRKLASPAVMDARCLPWRHVRVVPEDSLAGLQLGPNLT